MYTIIYEAIVGKRLDPSMAALWLDRFFKMKDKSSMVRKGSNRIVVLLIDELDALLTQK